MKINLVHRNRYKKIVCTANNVVVTAKHNLKPGSWVLVCRSVQVDCDVARLLACLISVAKEDDLDSQVIPTTS